MGGGVILIPPCVFHSRLSTQDIQGDIRMTLPPTAGKAGGLDVQARDVPEVRPAPLL
jgi:hypothetical protein